MVRIPLFLSSLESGSVRPLIYGKTAKPLSEFEGSAHLKNIPTNSSGDGDNNATIMAIMAIIMTIMAIMTIIATQTIMRNNYLDNIQFYYDLLISTLFPLKYFYCFLL